VRHAHIQRLWFKTKLAAAKLAYKSEDYAKALKVQRSLPRRGCSLHPHVAHGSLPFLSLSLFRSFPQALKELHEFCEKDKNKRGTQLLEVCPVTPSRAEPASSYLTIVIPCH
jgi:hypothetical protein